MTTILFPKTQEVSDMILIEKAVRTIHRIIKDDPKERAILLKDLKHCNLEYKGDYKALDAWLDRLEYDVFEEIEEKIADEQMKHEYKKELK